MISVVTAEFPTSLRTSKDFSKVSVFGTRHAYLWGMRTYYCSTLEEALRRAKKAGKEPGCRYGGIILPSGRKGFAIYREGNLIERYTGKTDAK